MGRSRPVKESSTKTNPSTTIETASKLEKLQKSIEELQKVATRYLDKFPPQSKSEMDDIELEISDENMEAMTHTIKKIVGRNGIKKMLTAIFDKHLLLEFNVDGRQNKKETLRLPKTYKFNLQMCL
ncbi:uncharacterized protein LOC119604771 isoform X2 [Lucilia sericata]|uniref:uncharacterized protein LOC119604771 isoform X2 n=1 Tax=Lucilia sericata TaxID=13632 RepID=UPI0018A83054|nr:uncharacterized protein LOC119604771 isoform X2 [Lucilia sericata]